MSVSGGYEEIDANSSISFINMSTACKASPSGWSKLFSSVCLNYGFAPTSVLFVKPGVPNAESGKSASTFSAALDTLPKVPERDRIYKDCPYESCIIF
jgi:hypothetical protein